MQPLLILFTAGVILTAGDLTAGKWIKNKSKILYFFVILLYMIGLLFLIESYKYRDIPVASILMEIFNIITLTIAGRFLFKETITSRQGLGIFIGLIAIIVLEL